MFCMKCGKELQEGAGFCAFCGAKVGNTGTTTDSASTGSMKDKFFKVASKAAVKTSALLGTASEKLGEVGKNVGHDNSPNDNGGEAPSEEDVKNISASGEMGSIFFEGPANMFYDNLMGKVGYAKGGKLFLAENGLYFKAHSLNVGEKEWSIPLSTISGVEKTMKLVLGIPSPNMIQVNCKNGEKYCFVVSKKETWIEQISAHI